MRVLHVITGLGAGGAELQLASLVQRSKHEVDVVTLYNAGAVADMIRAHGVSVVNLGMTKNTELPALLRLYRIIRAGAYDVVHAHLYRSQIYARPAARLAGTPVVVTTEHSIGETHIERRAMTPGVRALYLGSELFSDATIAVSDVVRARLVRWGVPARKIAVVPNGIDCGKLAFDPIARERVRAKFGIEADAYVIGVLCRLDPNKRVDMIVEAAVPLLGADCKLLIVGPGEEEARLRAQVARLGLTDHVIFAGYQSDVAGMMSAFDLYVAASVQETFGLSVLEALASGLPVLYTTCPALDGIQTEGARLVEGTVSSLEAEMGKEVEAGRRSRVTDSAVFGQYGFDSMTARIDDIYEQVIARRPRRSRWVSARQITSPGLVREGMAGASDGWSAGG
jgi:glycosyltransferase involved in cell wall biosynthesis